MTKAGYILKADHYDDFNKDRVWGLFGEQLFYYGDWIKIPGVAICSCNDGLRPVIFKLEATNEEAVIDYHPVKEE